jgi:gas vesicle protein
MGFGDKFKGLKDQAQQAVAENKDKIQGAVQVAAEVANTRTGGKYADKISNVGQKLSTSVDKFADEPDAAGATGGAPGTGAAGPAATVAADEVPDATVVEATPAPKVAPSAAPPEFE